MQFIEEEIPRLLAKLQPGTKPTWGVMSAEEMVDHLRIAVLLSIEDTDSEIVTPVERLPRYKEFLMSDKPFMPSAPKPESYNRIAALEGDMEVQKQGLLAELARMKLHFSNNPQHTAIHANFGQLNITEWYQLHKKHFTHHFTQFGLL